MQDFSAGDPKGQTPLIDRQFGTQRNNGATMDPSWLCIVAHVGWPLWKINATARLSLAGSL
jgi:hypothetical protein